ncbi:MAG: F0F1 ATP synthase subunit delta [Patescibacteria group bacterium]
MQNNTTYSKILRSVRTREELDTLTSELELLKKARYTLKKEGSFEKVLAREVQAPMAALLREALAQSSGDAASFIDGLEKILTSLTFVKLTLAFEPTEQQRARFSEWVYTNVGPGVVLDITVEPRVLGGAIIEHEGKFGDFSVRKKLEEIEI